MAAPFHPSLALTIGIVALIAWRMASRLRRLIGRQRLSPARRWFTVVFFPLLVLLLLLFAFARPMAVAGLLAGCAIGAALGLYGLRLTRFEATAEGLFFTPNPYIGIALFVLLVARLGWRYAQIYAASGQGDSGGADFTRSGVTLLVFGMLAGYYTAYSAGLLRWRASNAPAGPTAT